MPTILITNDDGVHAPGLLALKEALSKIGDVVVMAPERNQSAVSHTLTMHKPVRVTEVALGDGSVANACSGTPADCVSLATCGFFEQMPDLVVSGINNGYNLAVDVIYSGTVAGAREGVVNGIPGIAVSMPPLVKIAENEQLDMNSCLAMAANIACDTAEKLLAKGLPKHLLLNINVPAVTPEALKGTRMTYMGGRRYEEVLLKREDPRGKAYYWIGTSAPTDVSNEGSDVDAVLNGYASISPISIDMTDYEFLNELKNEQKSE